MKRYYILTLYFSLSFYNRYTKVKIKKMKPLTNRGVDHTPFKAKEIRSGSLDFERD